MRRDSVLRDADGNVIAEGSRELRDLAFMQRGPAGMSSDSLRYEKQLIDDWLRRDIEPALARH